MKEPPGPADRPGRADVAVVCDSAGVVVKVLRNSLTDERDAWMGAAFPELVDPGSRSKARNLLRETREEGAVFGWELALLTGDGIAPFHFAAGRTDQGLLVVGASSPTDVAAFYEEMMRVSNEQANELRQLLKERGAGGREAGATDPYEEMTRLNNELAKAQREMAKKNVELERLNDQKDQFLGMAAHDLRNPLSVILAYSEILLDTAGSDLPERQVEMLEKIESSSEFMLGLVNDLLDVSRIESGRLQLDREPVDPARLLRRNVELNAVLAEGKSITVSLEVEEDLPTLHLDPGKVEQVLNNLLSNAVKYSHEGDRVRVRAARRDGWVEIQVEDQGQGIPEEELEKLFEPFGTTSVSTTAGEESTGLGLMIARRIIRGHGGEIRVESAVGEGSTFTVALPVEEEGRRGG